MTGWARLLLALCLVPALAGCSGTGCDALPGLRAERDQARAAYVELTAGGTAGTAESERADEGVHELDRRVYELEQSCG